MANELVIKNGMIVMGGVYYSYKGITQSYIPTDNDYFIDCLSGSFSVVLPTAVSPTPNYNRSYVLKNSGSGVISIIGTASQTIDNSFTYSLSQYDSVRLLSNGNNWVTQRSSQITGSQGFQGVQGLQGLTGPQGFQGFQGLTGPQGFQGFQGLTGPQGFQGVQGFQGFQGLTGPQGPLPSTASFYVQGGNSFGATAMFGTNDNYNLVLETNSIPALIIATSGNISIGTSSTNTQKVLIVGSGTTSTTTSFLVQNSANTPLLNILNNGFVSLGSTASISKLYVAGGEIRVDAGQSITLDNSNVMYLVSASNQLRLYNGGLPRINITTAGNVGINNLSPSYSLDVTGSASISGQFYLPLIQTSSSTYSVTVDPTTGRLSYNAALTNIISNPAPFRLLIATNSVNNAIAVNNLTFNPSTSQLGLSGSIYISSTVSGSTLININGSSGQLFSVVDGLTGSLFTVNAISGLPLFTVNSDYSVYVKSLLTTNTLQIYGLTGSTRYLFIDTNGNVGATALTLGYYAQGGNSFGATATLGTNDNYNLVFKTNNTNAMIIATSGITINSITQSTVGTYSLFYNSNTGLVTYGTTLNSNPYISQGKLNASTQSIPSGVDTTIQFTIDFDPQNWWNGSTYRFTPTVAAYYTIHFGVWFENLGTSSQQVNIQARKSGTTFMIIQQPTTAVAGQTLAGSKIIYLNGTTDYVDFTAYQGTGTTKNIQRGSVNEGTWFSAVALVS